MQPEKLNSKDIEKYCYSSREVIEIQSSIYYSEEKLGFETLVERSEKYAASINSLLYDFCSGNPRKKDFSILEIGPGTGKFFKAVYKYLKSKNIKFTYTLIDITNEKIKYFTKEYSNIKIINKSFHHFAKTNNKSFDFLIANEALDMWAGDDYLLNSTTLKPVWILRNLKISNNSINLISKKKLTKLMLNFDKSNLDLVWERILIDKTSSEDNISHVMNDDIQKIALPKELGFLLEKIKIFAVFQDYWSYGDQNTLRIGFSSNYYNLFHNYITENYPENLTIFGLDKIKIDLEKELSTYNRLRTWITSNLFPFGTVDVTYTPDQDEFIKLANDLHFQVTSSEISYNNENFTLNGEILILFCENALNEKISIK